MGHTCCMTRSSKNLLVYFVPCTTLEESQVGWLLQEIPPRLMSLWNGHPVLGLPRNYTKRPGEPGSLCDCYKNRCYPVLGPQGCKVRIMSLEVQSVYGCKQGSLLVPISIKEICLSAPYNLFSCRSRGAIGGQTGIPEAAATLTCYAQDSYCSDKMPNCSQYATKTRRESNICT